MSNFVDRIKTDLNPPQQEAVTTTNRPLLVLSGAGTGKTRTISYKIAYLVLEKKYAPNRILALTFTNKAAREMRERTLEILSEYLPEGSYIEKQLYIGTFHANCIKILRWHGKILGYTSYFSIVDDDDQLSLIKRIIKEENLTHIQKASDARNNLSRLKNDFMTPEDVISLGVKQNNLFLQNMGVLYTKYQEELLRANSMDFDDIQLNVIYLFYKDKEIQQFWQNHFQAILVDEFQDTNKVQFLLLKMLSTPDSQNMTFVGDDDQSIYSFRGANIGNILNLGNEIPNLYTIRLEENYRSTESILNLANHTISYNENRLGKTLYTQNTDKQEAPNFFIAPSDEQEAQFCIDTIQSLKGPDESAAIIYRTNIQSKVFERELVQQGITYSLLGGRKFYEKKEMKDMIGYLRILANPEDNLAVMRVINIPARGIGDTSKEKLYHYTKQNNISLYKLLYDVPKEIRLSQNAKVQLQEWLVILADLKEMIQKDPSNILKVLIEAINYKAYLEEYDHDEKKTLDRIYSLDELERAYTKHLDQGGTFEAFVENISLMDSSDVYQGTSNTQNSQQSAIVLTSVHGCKGLEFDYVFVVGLVEEIFPHYLSIQTQEQLEEERRLFYVAITRAKKRLYLVSPSKMFARGQMEFFYQSRFIQEIPTNLIISSHGSLSRIDEKWYKDLLD